MVPPVDAEAGKFRRLAAGIQAVSKFPSNPAPVPPAPVPPKPAPVVSDECPNCNGTGRLGDGTIERVCPDCGGTGKKKVAEAPIRQGYPIRGNWWSGCSTWQHLATGEHKGKFDTAWLKTLSNSEVQSLHSDDHEGRVKWDRVVRPAPTVKAAAADCPNGVCPTNNRSTTTRTYGRRFFRWN